MRSATYLDSGVNICAGDRFVRSIKSISKCTHVPGVLSGVGGFSSLFDLGSLSYQDPILVSGADGVGTKLRLAIDYSRHDSIGIDLVAMCVNDVLVQGANPLFFLDYFSCSTLCEELARSVVSGIAEGCRQASCALIGGETAEMPGMYSGNDYDLAGFCVGVVEKSKMMNISRVSEGDIVVGIASSGIHSNGYSLVRYILNNNNIDVYQPWESGSLLDRLMVPTRIYVSSVLGLLLKFGPLVHAMAHITGGGLLGNIPRVLPDGLTARLFHSSWVSDPIFYWLKEQGNINSNEMFRVFNNGIGFVLIVSPDSAASVIRALRDCGEEAYEIGEIEVSYSEERVIILP